MYLKCVWYSNIYEEEKFPVSYIYVILFYEISLWKQDVDVDDKNFPSFSDKFFITKFREYIS